MNIVERAARAMFATANQLHDWNEPNAEPLRKIYRENARAALHAIREPDEEMIGAADDLTDTHANIHPTGLEVWYTMIDVALDENDD
ncbi:hypothetical protein KFK14_14960 [Sphingobium phenoxybenzoativorans]|uniref:Uncharacterized protein n=1 Tax=Sphingobium phenoxybenzoativorans TaxID=1592790 RepID=A0A975Q0G0_9SPHN|nr:hypothetical protein [Sphingobium phenoxybenzoativorans]QUT04363.1 hypothetical protein KFK14_14960 [Sphingobium phenoxybenzoativorans]